MNYFTTDLHETKREISIFSNKLSENISKPTSKFMFDMLYGITASCSCLTSEIARTLQEPCKLKNTIERLCDHLYKMDENEKATIQSNYMKEVAKYVPDSPLILLDDSEIVKEYGKKFEDLCLVRDASSLKDEIKPGYHVAEAVVISEKQKQPIPIYSHVYSTESKGFKSKDRGYDSTKVQLPSNPEIDLTLVIVYGLSEEEPN